MSPLCRLGLHRWSFASEILEEAPFHTRTEIVRARCRRAGCSRYGDWSFVHRESHIAEGSRTEALSRDAAARAA